MCNFGVHSHRSSVPLITQTNKSVSTARSVHREAILCLAERWGETDVSAGQGRDEHLLVMPADRVEEDVRDRDPADDQCLVSLERTFNGRRKS